MTELSMSRPDTAVVLNRDLLFGSRIRGALAALGLRPKFVGTTEAFVIALRDSEETVAIGIVDMNGPIAWDALEHELAIGQIAVPTLAFGPHTDVEQRRAAKQAGITRIVSNGQFHNDMQRLIERYRRH